MTLNFKFSASADHYPHDLLPALTFMRGALPPNKVQVLVGDEGVPLGESIECPDVVPVEEEYVQLVEDLSRLQRETGTFFAMPPEFTQEDLRELAQALALLDREDVTFKWNDASFKLNVVEPERFLQEVVSKAQGGAFIQEGQGKATIAGHTVPLGKMRTYLPAARIANVDTIRRAVEGARSGEELTVELALEALNDATGKTSLVPD